MAYQEKKRWMFLGLPFTFTKYTIEEEVITINSGLLNTRENDCYMYKVQDVELETSLAERIFGLGTTVIPETRRILSFCSNILKMQKRSKIIF